jgi:hypothetical protein
MSARLAFSFSQAEYVTLALLGVLVVIVALMGYRAWEKSRISPQERERLRRESLVATGKMGDATLTEIRECLLFYAYVVRGVEYTASQDVSQLKERIPADLSSLGPVSLRYDPKNPANSIVVAEQWSGLRLSEPKRHP